GSRRTCTSTSSPAGAATPTSCRSSGTPRCCRSCCATPAGCSPTPGPPSEAAGTVTRGAAARERPVLVYDGDCGFCTSSARFIERHVPVRAAFVPYQHADLDALGVTAERARHEVLWIDRARSEERREGKECSVRE